MWATLPKMLLEANAMTGSSIRCMDWARRLSRAAWGFSSVSADSIVAHYCPSRWDKLDLDLFLMCCRHARNDLATKFGFPLHRVRVFLFDSHETVAALYGRPLTGFAMSGANWIVVLRCEHMEETARHELVHLFAGRWNEYAPALLTEGLAVWLTRSHNGRPIDIVARGLVPHYGSLSEWLDYDRFHDPRYEYGCYILAGSFTGYLLRHFGWGRYRHLYRQASPGLFVSDFQEVFGIDLDQAEKKWRAELLRSTPLRSRA